MKKKIFFITLLVISTILITMLASYSAVLDDSENDIYLPSQLIRLHVVANSNSEEDQALKRQVRDKMVEETYLLFRNAKDVEEAKSIAIKNLENIRQITLTEIRKSGKPYDVRIEIGKFMFPAKNYGSLNLAAGKYEALRVVIGSGKGNNWWCILFPPLCFIDAENGLAIDQLSDNSNLKSSPIKLKFKILEVLKKEQQKRYLAKLSQTK